MTSEKSENPGDKPHSARQSGPHIEPFEEERRAILGEALKAAPFDGFTAVSLKRAAEAAGVSPAAAAAAFPGGVLGLVEYWSQEADEAAAASLRSDEAQQLKLREKVARAVNARLDYLAPNKEAARRAAAFLALPLNAPTGARLTWRTADLIWRAMNDPSTDFNFYTKRASLSAVLTTTFARWMSDDSEDRAATRAFLDARIDNVIQYHRLKSKVLDKGFDPEGMFGWLAKLRYPQGR